MFLMIFLNKNHYLIWDFYYYDISCQIKQLILNIVLESDWSLSFIEVFLCWYFKIYMLILFYRKYFFAMIRYKYINLKHIAI